MFGNKKYKNAKEKTFSSDTKRKQYFAIRDYYKKKDASETKQSMLSKKTQSKKQIGKNGSVD